MPQTSGGSLAMKIGSICRHQAQASRLALDTAAASDFGRMGNVRATASSVARAREAVSMKARGRRLGFRCATAIQLSSATRKTTSSALGGGISSGCDGAKLTRQFPSPAHERRINGLGYCAAYGRGVLRRAVTLFCGVDRDTPQHSAERLRLLSLASPQDDKRQGEGC